MTFEPLRLTERDAIRAYLNQDRRLTAYALGDLDDAFWPKSEFWGARVGGELRALVLLFRGLDPAVLTAFGDPDGVRAVFEAMTLPPEIYYLFPPEMETLADAYYERPNASQEWRMVLNPGDFKPPALDGVTRLQPEHADALGVLFKHAAEPGEEVVAFSPWQIGHGVFYGVWQNDRLVATAGTHVWSVSEQVATIGNVFTMPNQRSHGYATRCTAAVVRDSLAAGIDNVVLNVRYGNDAALHVYEKLGFRRYCTFLEGPGLRRK